MDLTSKYHLVQYLITSSLVDVTRTSGKISREDLSFHRSSSSSLSGTLDAQNVRLLRLTQKLLKVATTSGSNVSPPKLQDVEEVDEKWHGLVDVFDDLLERADACLDEYTGVIKRLSPGAQDAAMTPTIANGRSNKFPSLFATQQLAKPQLLFERSHSNHEAAPFKPLLREKPHRIIDLDVSIGVGGAEGYHHPYAVEIQQSIYPDAVYTTANPLPYSSPTESEAVFVNTREGVEEMLAELRQASEIAIDLEHHDLHSYFGIVCLMQISTRQKDWIIDTLVPWREDLQILNDVFADPKILKVLHGSTMDIMWLQRDLGLYIVGLFDTFHASTALGFPQKSLKYLLERFCGVHANKKFQMADWRIRPIPDEMLDYARADTHYLLYIYDNLRNMLLEASSPSNNLVNYVLQESKKEALQRYERAVYDAVKGLGSVGWFAPLARRSVSFTCEQLGVYRAVHEWRDRTARACDEGVTFIMSQATLFAVAEAMPTTVPALMAVTNPVSKAIKDASRDLIEIVKKGKDAGREGPTIADVMRQNEAFLPRKRKPPTLAEHGPANEGSGTTLQMLDSNGDLGSNADRLTQSRFWGTVAKLRATDSAQSLSLLDEALRVILPLPAFGAVSYTSPGLPVPLTQGVESSTQPSPRGGSTEKADFQTAFILKEVDRPSKRKAKDADLDPNVISSPPTSGLEADAKDIHFRSRVGDDSKARSESKAGREEGKRQKKALREAAAKREIPTEPFDYANAPSVLHAKPDKEHANGAPGAQRQFHPSVKALDGPAGYKKARKETAGKSFTFKR